MVDISAFKPKEEKGQARDLTTLELMKMARRWIIWKYGPISVPGKKAPKVPYYLNGKLRGETDTPEDVAQLVGYEAAKEHVSKSGGVYHLGFALGLDGNGGAWQGVDFDADPQLTQIGDLPGYIERSISGAGWHCVSYGRPFAPRPDHAIDGQPHTEAYSSGRYFSVTEDVVRDRPPGDLYDYVGSGPPLERSSLPERPVEQLSETQLHDLKAALRYLDPDPYGSWVAVALALQKVESGLELFLAWSRRSAKHKDAEATKKFNNVGLPFAPWRSIFSWAKEAGWDPSSVAADAKEIDYDIGAPRHMEFVLDGFVRAGSLILAGAPGVGKTSLVVPLAATVAHLTTLDDLRPVLRRRVYYVTEDHEQVVRMLRGMRLMGMLRVPDAEVKLWFRIIPSVRTTPKAWELALTELLRDAATEQPFPSGPYRVEPLVVLDTVAANLDLADENDNAAVSRAVAAIRAGVGPASSWMVAHTPKALKRADPDDMSARGAGAWSGDTQGEAYIFSEPDQPEHRYIRLGKRRFDADFEELRVGSRLEEEKVKAPWGEQVVRYRVACEFERSSKEEREGAREQRGELDDQGRLMAAMARFKKALAAAEGLGLAVCHVKGAPTAFPDGYGKASWNDLLKGIAGKEAGFRAKFVDAVLEQFKPGNDGRFYTFKKPDFGIGKST